MAQEPALDPTKTVGENVEEAFVELKAALNRFNEISMQFGEPMSDDEMNKLLIEQGFPRQALLMTIVRDLEGEGHAILTVKTDHGEFVLDNLSDEIRPWDATGYSYVKRQSQEDPNVWLDLGGVRGVSAATAVGADGG